MYYKAIDFPYLAIIHWLATKKDDDLTLNINSLSTTSTPTDFPYFFHLVLVSSQF